MTATMQILYDHAEETLLPNYLSGTEYHKCTALTDRLHDRLRQLLAEDDWDILDKFLEVLLE